MSKFDFKVPYTKTSEAINGYADSSLAKSERADCVVRAIASASGMTYDKAHKWVADTFNRKPKRGTYGFDPKMNRLAKENKRINRKKVITIDKRLLKTNGGKSQMTVGTFIKEYNRGSYVITVSGHAFTIKDGSVIGNWDDAVSIRKRVQGAWKIGA